MLRFYPPIPMTGDRRRRHAGAARRLEVRHSRIPRPMAVDPPALEDAAAAASPSLYERHVKPTVPRAGRCSIVKLVLPPMTRLEALPLHGSVVALALTAVALLISLLLRPYLEPDTFLLFVVAVWLSAWYYGRMIGLVATARLRPGAAVFLHPQRQRRCGWWRRGWARSWSIAVPDHLDYRRVAREPPRAGVHPRQHRRRGAGHR